MRCTPRGYGFITGPRTTEEQADLRYLRTWPPEAGNAALTETVAVPAELAERVGALVAALGWEGIFELELVRVPAGAH